MKTIFFLLIIYLSAICQTSRYDTLQIADGVGATGHFYIGTTDRAGFFDPSKLNGSNQLLRASLSDSQIDKSALAQALIDEFTEKILGKASASRYLEKAGLMKHIRDKNYIQITDKVDERGNSSYDYEPDISAAIDTTQSNGWRKIFFPSGKYYMDRVVVQSKDSIIFEGQMGTEFHSKYVFPQGDYDVTPYTAGLFALDDVESITFRNIEFYGNSDVWFPASWLCPIRLATTSAGISRNIIIENCKFYNFGPIFFTISSGFDTSAVNIDIRNCEFFPEDTVDAGINIRKFVDATIENNRYHGNDIGSHFLKAQHGQRLRVAFNRADSTWDSGIYINGITDHCTVIGNQVRMSGKDNYKIVNNGDTIDPEEVVVTGNIAEIAGARPTKGGYSNIGFNFQGYRSIVTNNLVYALDTTGTGFTSKTTAFKFQDVNYARLSGNLAVSNVKGGGELFLRISSGNYLTISNNSCWNFTNGISVANNELTSHLRIRGNDWFGLNDAALGNTETNILNRLEDVWYMNNDHYDCAKGVELFGVDSLYMNYNNFVRHGSATPFVLTGSSTVAKPYYNISYGSTWVPNSPALKMDSIAIGNDTDFATDVFENTANDTVYYKLNGRFYYMLKSSKTVD